MSDMFNRSSTHEQTQLTYANMDTARASPSALQPGTKVRPEPAYDTGGKLGIGWRIQVTRDGQSRDSKSDRQGVPPVLPTG